MKKKVFSLFATFFILIFAPLNVFCQDESKIIDPDELLRSANDEIFVRSAFVQNFTEQQGIVNEFPDADAFHQYFISKGVATDLIMSIFPSAKIVRTTNKRINFDQFRKNEFHVKFVVRQNENVPSHRGGKCWIRFSNVILLGKGRESGIIVYPGDQAYYFKPVDGEMTYESIADLSSINPEKKFVRFDFIRLDGTTYVYTNGIFQFQYNDEIKEAVSFEGGSELSLNGNRVSCSFDDFAMWTK